MTVTAVRIGMRVFLIPEGLIPKKVDAVYGAFDVGDVLPVGGGAAVLRHRTSARRRLPFDTPVDVSIVDVLPERIYL